MLPLSDGVFYGPQWLIWMSCNCSIADQVKILNGSLVCLPSTQSLQLKEFSSTFSKSFTIFLLCINNQSLWWKCPNLLCNVSATLSWLGKHMCSSLNGFKEKKFTISLSQNISYTLESLIRHTLSSNNNLNPLSRSFPTLNKLWSISGTNKT